MKEVCKVVYPIMMKDRDDVIRVNQIASQQPFDLSLSTMAGPYIAIDAKSLLAMFSLIGREVYLVGPDDLNPKYFSKLIKRMKLS